jgi:hypothetical protein
VKTRCDSDDIFICLFTIDFCGSPGKKKDITRVLVHGNNGFLFSDIKGFMGLIR